MQSCTIIICLLLPPNLSLPMHLNSHFLLLNSLSRDIPREKTDGFTQSERELLEVLKKKIVDGKLMEGEAFANAGEAVVNVHSTSESHSTSTKSSKSQTTQESVHISNGVKTIVRKTIVDGVVVSSTRETIKDSTEGKGSATVEVFEEDDSLQLQSDIDGGNDHHEAFIHRDEDVDYDDEVVGVLADNLDDDYANADDDDEDDDDEDDEEFKLKDEL